MEITLVQTPSNPWDTMYIAARTCYSAREIKDLCKADVGLEKKKELVKKVLSSGHLSIAEHICFTIGIDGISRSCSHQLVRHRLCTFSQQSQRYVEYKESITDVEKMTTYTNLPTEDKDYQILDKYFIWNHENYSEFITLATCLYRYLRMVEEGIKPEDARQVLPNAMKTNLVMTCNLRQLIHISELRLCTRAQKEIRTVFYQIKKELCKYDEELGALLMPKCDKMGFCTEEKSCGRRMHFVGGGH